ncbi:MAG: aldehyde dehydrogenase family protein [Acidimicrobiia bacterium]|nr:aldehyde dehydrogenase family protein [Acidimicrobiia bacterium]
MRIVYGGNRLATVDSELAAAFTAGDHLVVVQDTGALLHIPADVHATATEAVDAASSAFGAMGSVSDGQIETFFDAFAARLADDTSFGPIAEANAADVENARSRGRSVTRLILSEDMRSGMIDGLRSWARMPSGRSAVVDRVDHEGWAVETVRSGLGVVAFVFEGRPNVFADATGVIRGGNTVVFRIGSDALGTARAIVANALDPALAESGLPPGAVSLVNSPSRAAGWAMFSDTRLGLAVARGSGGAVSQLGAVARQAGIPVSLHGTGGAWIVASESADADRFEATVTNSLDRKVCNTLNTCCIVESRAADLVPRFLAGLRAAADRRGVEPKLHIADGDESHVPAKWFGEVGIARADGTVTEPMSEAIGRDRLGVEWEWEDSPEVTLVIVPDVATAVVAFNEQSPKFAASLISEDADEHELFFATIDSPFVGDGFTRWVDGHYALGKPELGLSNWQFGRLFGRGGILSGDSAFTVRTRARQSDPDLGR